MTALKDVAELSITLHCGGLFTGANARVIGADMYDFIMKADAQLQALTGQPLGRAYQEQLLPSGDVVLDSVPPIRALLAAERAGGKGLAMLLAIHDAHYLDGRRVCDEATLRSLAPAIGVPDDAFDSAWRATTEAVVQAHIAATRSFMARHGSRGFPTFVLECGGTSTVLDHQSHYGKPRAWRDHVLDAMKNGR